MVERESDLEERERKDRERAEENKARQERPSSTPVFIEPEEEKEATPEKPVEEE